ncbi:cyclic AMP-dependent transcription factor ATF-2-like [Stylophora pistillata]|uniref:Cyclic AMP-dependent transcription factor ATF-2 n=1 Tax=Stylophora pistillata TaxID=50429 RepID=A0A2B4S8E9_STYPI|nr:cyclic AMP-dependent transcription factor ATF-2-like [Stylophora pistillata]PFX24877.1 Cyclic AMP-dependent transcription factor ATF-2 [Stylophora pistillata]
MRKEGFKMEESDDKPFQCTTPGCGQRFANNDHLERHKQKHQLTLKFGSLKGTDLTVADQTPTPTRFLRNCEEEGLFQDLDNPFDQDFKRAADQPSNSSTSHSSAHLSDHNQASLASNGAPTQSVIVIEEAEPKLQLTPPVENNTAADTKKVIISAAPVSVLVRVPPHIPPAIPASIAAPDAQVPSALPVPSHLHGRLNSTRSSMPIPSIPTPAIVSSPSASSPPSFMGSAKQRLKEQLKMNQAAQSNNIIHRAMTEAVDMVTSQHNGLPVSPANHINHQQTTVITHNSPQDTKKMSGASKRPRRTQDELDPDERRKRFLERNRAAATRCREKRKIWVQQLEKKADDLSNTNAHLQSEITLLRTEVAQLKSLLLAHKDCPVTIAQQRNAQMLNHQVGEQTNGVHTNNSHGTDAASAEDVATSALTQMAHRATLELENLAATTMSSVITTNTNPIGV